MAFKKVTGGNTKMFGPQSAGPQVPGVSAHKTSGTGGMFGKGGNTPMFGKQSAGPKSPAVSGKAQSGSGGKWAAGGTTKMQPFTPVAAAKPGQSAP